MRTQVLALYDKHACNDHDTGILTTATKQHIAKGDISVDLWKHQENILSEKATCKVYKTTHIVTKLHFATFCIVLPWQRFAYRGNKYKKAPYSKNSNKETLNKLYRVSSELRPVST